MQYVVKQSMEPFEPDGELNKDFWQGAEWNCRSLVFISRIFLSLSKGTELS